MMETLAESYMGNHSKNKRPGSEFDTQEHSELDMSGVTEATDHTEDSEDLAPNKGLKGFVGRLFRIPWAQSEPEEHDRGRALRRAVRAQDLDLVRSMIREGAGVNESQEASLACIATRRRNLDLLQTLIHADVDLNRSDRRNRSSRTRTPLQEASRKGWVEGMEALIKAGVDIDSPDDGGATALHLAVRAGHRKAVALLLQAGAKPDGHSTARMAPLHEVAQVDVAKLLLDSNASHTARDKGLATPLHHQSKAGRLGLVEVLLARGADANALDARGRNALFMPGAKGDVLGVFAALLRAGAKTEVRDHDLNTFVHVLITRSTHTKSLEWAFEQSPELWGIKNSAGETPLDMIKARGFQDLVFKVERYLEKEEEKASIVKETRHSLFGSQS